MKNELLNSIEETHDRENSNFEQLVSEESISGTPFHIIRADKKYFIALANHRISDIVESKEELLKQIETKNWNLLINSVVAITKIMTK